MTAEHDLQQLRQALQGARSDKERLTRALETLAVIANANASRKATMPGFYSWLTTPFEWARDVASVAFADLAVGESATEKADDLLSRVGERIDAQQHRILELESLVAKSAQNADVRADADSVPGYKDRVFALAAEIAVLVCVRDVAYVDDRPGRKRLDQAANEVGYLLGLPEPEFAELWTARIDRSLVDRATNPVTRGPVSGAGGNTAGGTGIRTTE